MPNTPINDSISTSRSERADSSARQLSVSAPVSRTSSRSDQRLDIDLPGDAEPADPEGPPQHPDDFHRFCLAITKSALVGGFVGGAVGGAVMGIPGAILFAVGGAWSGGLLGSCLEFVCAPLGAERAGHARQLQFEIV